MNFEIDDGELTEYMGNITRKLYPNSRLYLKDKLNGKCHYYLENVTENIEVFFQKVNDAYPSVKAEQIEQNNMKKCEVVKINNDYYVYDPQTKNKFKLHGQLLFS